MTSTVVDIQQLLDHFQGQLASVRRLIAIMDAQENAIRAHDVEGVIESAYDLQAELGRRIELELQRKRLLCEAASKLGVVPEEVTLDMLLEGVEDEPAEHARMASRTLGELIAELTRRHQLNRDLLHQELAFVEHMLAALGVTQKADTYSDGAQQTGIQTGETTILDVKG